MDLLTRHGPLDSFELLTRLSSGYWISGHFSPLDWLALLTRSAMLLPVCLTILKVRPVLLNTGTRPKYSLTISACTIETVQMESLDQLRKVSSCRVGSAAHTVRGALGGQNSLFRSLFFFKIIWFGPSRCHKCAVYATGGHARQFVHSKKWIIQKSRERYMSTIEQTLPSHY